MGEKIKEFILKSSKKIDFSVAPVEDSFEKSLISQNPELGIINNSVGYRREGYILLDFVSQKMIYEWLSDYSKKDIFKKIYSKLTNSGMSAIDLVLHALGLNKEYTLIAPKDIYFASGKVIDSYNKKMFKQVLRPENISQIKDNIIGINGKKILYLEVCSNSQDMTFFDNGLILELAKLVDYLIIDGTTVGLCKINPMLFERGNIIYVESLSKNYHDEESSPFTAGLIIYPKRLENQFEERYSRSGIYLSINALLDLPLNLYETGKKRIMEISKNVQEFYAMIINLKNDKIKISKISDDINQVPLIVFFSLTDNENLKRFIEFSNLSKRSSFGHDETYILPIGLMFDTAPEGLLRIAFGKNNINVKIINALEKLGEEN